jgi:hypothetical protein
MAKEFKGQNGKRIVINTASFKEATALKKAIEKELLKTNVSLDVKSLQEINEKYSMIEFLNLAKNFIFSCETSDEFERVLFECLKHCTYDNIQIKEQLFDDVPEAREDYYMIVFECIKENVLPFFKSLLSKFSILKAIRE